MVSVILSFIHISIFIFLGQVRPFSTSSTLKHVKSTSTKPTARLTVVNSDNSDFSACNDIPPSTRRAFLSNEINKAQTLLFSISFLTSTFPLISKAYASPPRIEGLGGGFDMLQPPSLRSNEVTFPKSMEGHWICQRYVTSVEGDSGQAFKAWNSLGGTIYDSSESQAQMLFRDLKRTSESYKVRFYSPESTNIDDLFYEYDGSKVRGVLLDRGYEMYSRLASSGKLGEGNNNDSDISISWDPLKPNHLVYQRNRLGAINVDIVQRTIELPSQMGWGSNELYRVEEPLSRTPSSLDVFSGGSSLITRAIRIQRRYRRNFDENGGRIVEALEIMKTYRVLDGVAGIEMPTSTTKSIFRFTPSEQ